jgi:3-hydroxyacyl-CoA dehydrogenase
MSVYTVRNGVAIVRLLNPPVNMLSHAVRSAVVASLAQAQHDKVKAVVLLGDGSTFPAGADIGEFATGKWREYPDINDLAKELEASPLPVVAAIHGHALGGGLETALACHFRVALPSAKLGLPEVGLGILPGAGGTQRLPRVVGVEKAIELITSGRHVSAAEAASLGLVDKVVAGKSVEELVDGAVAFALEQASAGALPVLSHRRVAPPAGGPATYDAAKKELAKTMRNLKAPQAIVDAVRSAAEAPTFEAGLKEEGRLFEGLMAGPQAKALQYMFFAERDCSKVPGVDAKQARDVKSVGVIGGGTMGRGIAMCFLNKGVPVLLCETSEAALAAGVEGVRETYKKSSAFRSGKMSEADLAKTMKLLSGSADASLGALKDSDAVIEAVFENLQLKKDIFARLGKVCKKDALLCSNTSYLDVDVIGAASGRPESFLGTHFFSPANVMPLLENVKGAKTSPAAIATAMKMGKAIGKTTVLAGNCFGFIGNRMFEPYTQQAVCLLEEGASPGAVDGAMGPAGFGFAMGPLAVYDLAGNDIGYRIRREAYYPHSAQKVEGRRGATWMKLADALCDAGRLGQKTGKGWYAYDGRKPIEDALVAEICDKHRAANNINKRASISQQEILERCLYPMVNEGFKILEEKIASRPSDIDVVWGAGYGAPRYQPPMWYADNVVGLPKLLSALNKYRNEQPELPGWHFKPSALLEELVKSNKTLAQYFHHTK